MTPARLVSVSRVRDKSGRVYHLYTLPLLVDHTLPLDIQHYLIYFGIGMAVNPNEFSKLITLKVITLKVFSKYFVKEEDPLLNT